MIRRNIFLAVLPVAVLCLGLPSADAAALKALIVDGQNNHKWEEATPIIKQALEQTGLFDVKVATSPPKGRSLEGFSPQFAARNVVVLNYNGDDWPKQTQDSFVQYVRGGGGVVVVHAADNSFPRWKEYNEIIGLGGWGGRNEKSGPYVYWKDGQIVRDTSPGRGGTHGNRHVFQVVNRDRQHPITKDLPEKWMHAEDELYSLMRGPAENLTVLATAYHDPAQRGTDRHEPVLFTIGYGKGRVFHTVLGHDARAMSCVGFIVTLQRGAEWAATGNVTQKVPEDFPAADKVSVRLDYDPLRHVDKLLTDIAKYEYGQSREPLTTLTDLIRSLHGRPDTIAQIERRFLKFLQSKATAAAKQFICRQLSIIGTEEAVPVLTMMLFERPTSEIQPADMARYALERIPSPAVDWALRNALDKTTGRVKVGVINSIGNRGDEKAVAQLKALLNDSDEEIVEAAMAALGKIGGTEAAAALDAARPKKSAAAERCLAWANASLMCADKFRAQGMRRPAWQIYSQLYAADKPAQVRAAALRGIVATRPRQAGNIIIGVLEGDDVQMQSAAIGLLSEVSGTELTRAVTDRLPDLSVTAQVQVLAALAGRRDPSALPAVLEAARSDSADVRVAALTALGALGDASSVDLLAKTAADTTGPEQQAARDSLYRLRPSDVDDRILAAIPDADAKVKLELIRSIGERNMTRGVDALFKTARAPEPDVRIESLKVLKLVADPQYLSPLLDLLTGARDEAERRQAEDTVAAAVRKAGDEDQRARHVLTITTMLASVRDVTARSSLLNVLGKIGHDSAVPILRAALKDPDAEVKDAAIRALSEWPTDKPADDLLNIARGSDDQRRRILALRGFVRLIGLDSQRPPDETIKMYQQAMELAPNANEKRMVLSGLANVKSLAALRMAEGHLQDDGLRQEAEAAVIKIAEAAQAGHPKETKEVLRKIVRESKNDSVRQRAQKLIEQIERFEDYITDWQAAGPYSQENKNAMQLFDIVFAPEQSSAPGVQWSPLPAGTDIGNPWLIELDRVMGGDNQVAYLRTRVWSAKKQNVSLLVGSNDAIKVWLNGEVVHSNNVMRTIVRDEDKAEVTLREGWNTLLMKVTQSGGNWSACARFRAPDGSKLEGLKVRTEE